MSGALEVAIEARLLTPTAVHERAWQIATRSSCGRYLVAARDLGEDEVVFSEMPLIVATPSAHIKWAMRGDMAAVAIELLREPPNSPAYLLQQANFADDKDGALAGCMRMWTLGMLRALQSGQPLHRNTDKDAIPIEEASVGWALSVASTNVHGRADPERGILGLLASMMEHNCSPSAYVDVASAAKGSQLTLRTRRAVRAGESLSISYVEQDAPVNERRRLLRLQHGFTCECERCVAELALIGETSESEYWRQSWENRIWQGLDPYSGDST